VVQSINPLVSQTCYSDSSSSPHLAHITSSQSLSSFSPITICHSIRISLHTSNPSVLQILLYRLSGSIWTIFADLEPTIPDLLDTDVLIVCFSFFLYTFFVSGLVC